LVTIEPVSNFILLEQYAADRTAATWTAALEGACTGLAVEVIQSTADEAKALRRHAETDLGATTPRTSFTANMRSPKPRPCGIM
jgi:hypothetical protein